MTQSGSMFADGIHSFSDGASNIIGMIGIWVASNPPDEDHPYGHQKYETFSALAISTFLFVVCFFIIKGAITRFFHPVVPEVTSLSFVVMIVTMFVALGVTLYERRVAKELKSDLLMSDALHTQTDVLTSLAVIVALIGTRMGFPIVDPIVSLVIAAVIGWAAFGIIKESSDVLCDKVVLDEKEIKRVAMTIPGVKDCHEVRTRGRKDYIYVDLHILVDSTLSVEAAHEIANNIEDTIKEKIQGVFDVFVHIEPLSHHHSPNSPDKH